MSGEDRGTWWHVRADGDRIRIAHGPTIDGEPRAARATVLVGLDAACELAVGIVHAALEVDAARAQAAMLALWVREV